MCIKCGESNHDGRARQRERRQLLFTGLGLAAAPLLGGVPLSARAQQSPAAAVGSNLGASSVRAWGMAAAGAALGPLQIPRRAVGPKDVLIDVLYCGVCHTDIHIARGDWGPPSYPLVPGHEFVGRVVAVGNEVRRFKVGDAAGVGCMVNSCGTCDNCKAGIEQFCLNGNTLTYNGPDRVHGGHTLGGYSERIVVTERFVITIPPGADLAATAPLLCAGVTTFSPMQHWKLEAGQRVGVIGLGGLGHMALKLAVARSADVTVFTTSPGKVADAQRMGAREAVLPSDSAAMQRLASKFDLLIATVPSSYAVQPFMNLLKVDGTLVNLGSFDPLQEVRGAGLIRGRRSLAGSLIGGVAETQQVVDYCAQRNIQAEIELIRPDQIAQAFDRVVKKDVRYRFVIDVKAGLSA